ncbi:hypothetical protein KY290_004925 [Solanum tuberosum]|uniref:Uncharacterized protein n=1 Tax=Solanum tuberosum TaxID=4113 RepID=A0ABQ7WEG9_SOLTU|nr:hypothetical protein KY290_004925 [Solanum tuberosum]
MAFDQSKMPALNNTTIFCLIPKCPDPPTLKSYRPIGLCNTSYKLVTKIIVNLIKPILPSIIGPSQASFLSNRRASNNAIIVQEYITHFGGPKISHLFFVDELCLFARADNKNCITIAKILNDFCTNSGQRVNLSKSKAIHSKNSNTQTRIMCSILLGMENSETFGKYLGFPIFHQKPRNSDFHYIIDNMRKKMVCWKTKFLNMTNRVVLAKATLKSMPSHVIQYIKMPAKITDTMNKIQRDFIWGTINEKRKIHLLNWDTITNNKNMGGLGIQKIEIKNRAILSSLAWRIIQNPDKLWSKVLMSKYHKPNTSSSYPVVSRTWKNIQNYRVDNTKTTK